MAYDPYARGSDNPWIGNLDMPRSNPAAKPGASRAAALAPAKKKPKPINPDELKGLSWTNGKISRDAPLPPVRPAGASPPAPPRRPADTAPSSPDVPLPPTRPFELTPGAQPMEQSPPITGGILAGPPPAAPLPPVGPGVGDYIQSQLFNQGKPLPSPGAMVPERSTPLTSGTVAPGAPPGGPVINTGPPTGAPTPVMDPGILNFLRSQLFNQGKPVT